MALRRSRPCASVPSRKRGSLPCTQRGGSSASSTSRLARSKGLVSAIRGASKAAMAMSPNKSAARRHELFATRPRSSCAFEADARIEHEAQDVDERVGDDEQEADEDEISGNERYVGARHRF